MIGDVRHCKKCGHRCHCYSADCQECINDVCTVCDCKNSNEPLHSKNKRTRVKKN